MDEADEIGELTIGITKVSGKEFGAKEFLMRVPDAIIGTTFQLDNTTFKVTRSKINRANIPL
ncbi:hypothetical protein ACW9HR_19000 [Nocardia gipuzkoensis]